MVDYSKKKNRRDAAVSITDDEELQDNPHKEDATSDTLVEVVDAEVEGSNPTEQDTVLTEEPAVTQVESGDMSVKEDLVLSTGLSGEEKVSSICVGVRDVNDIEPGEPEEHFSFVNLGTSGLLLEESPCLPAIEEKQSLKGSPYTLLNTETLESSLHNNGAVVQRYEKTSPKSKEDNVLKEVPQKTNKLFIAAFVVNTLLCLAVCGLLGYILYSLHQLKLSRNTELCVQNYQLSDEDLLDSSHRDREYKEENCTNDKCQESLEALNATIFNDFHSSFRNQDLLINILNNPNLLFSHSCASIHAVSPASPSGYYWFRSSNGSFVSLYCDMELECGGVSGGWTRLVQWDMADCNTQCPSADFVPLNDNGVRKCGIPPALDAWCEPTNFTLSKDLVYSKVCGRVAAYASGSPDAFASTLSEVTIDSVYLDGVSLTHGPSGSRSHIWSFAACTSGSTSCSCLNSSSSRAPPAFVGSDYFCDSSGPGGSAPLWQNCSSVDLGSKTCPWFFKDLPAATSDAIELRACADQHRVDEDVAISAVEIYIQ